LGKITLASESAKAFEKSKQMSAIEQAIQSLGLDSPSSVHRAVVAQSGDSPWR
jgi:hypothetical protein